MCYGKLTSALYIFGMLLRFTLGCGTITHQDVTARALDGLSTSALKQVLLDNINYVKAGSAFPDWGYLCGREAGDKSHWTPFVEALSHYITETYQPGSQKYNILTSFMFGVQSHILADILWHYGQGAERQIDRQGYLQTMSHIGSDCDDLWNSDLTRINCHVIGDNGADFYLGGRGDTSFSNHYWTIPASDILKVYTRMKISESQATLTACTAGQFLGNILNEHFGSYITFFLERKTTFLTEELDLWFHGGIEDMASAVTLSWAQLAKDHQSRSGVPHANQPGQKGLLYACKVFGINFLMDKFNYYSDLIGVTQNYLGRADSVQFSFDLKTLVKNKEILITALLAEYGIQVNQDTVTDVISFDLDKAQNEIQGEVSHSYFGKSIAVGDFNGDGKEEMFVGAPGYHKPGYPELGGVYFTNLKKNISNRFNGSEPYLKGPIAVSRFGFAMVALDLNRDGYDDLVVSAPGYGRKEWGNLTIDYDQVRSAYNGRVYVYFGGPYGVHDDSVPDIVIRRKEEDDPFFNMGFGLRASDCNGDGFEDLLILSPYAGVSVNGDQTGHLAVFQSLTKLNNITQNLFLEDADITLTGVSNHSWFGFDAVCAPDRTLFVGAPGSRIREDILSSGAVYAYNSATLKLLYVLKSDQEQEKFGQSLDYSAQHALLAVGAPTKVTLLQYGIGAVYLYNSTATQYYQYQAIISSSERAGRYGKKLKFINTYLVVSAPSLSARFAFQVPTDQGRIYLHPNVQTLVGNVSAAMAVQQYQTAEPGCRHGETLAYSQQTSTLLMGSPFCSNNNTGFSVRLGGRVYFLDMRMTNEQAALNKFLETVHSYILATFVIFIYAVIC